MYDENEILEALGLSFLSVPEWCLRDLDSFRAFLEGARDAQRGNQGIGGEAYLEGYRQAYANGEQLSALSVQMEQSYEF